MIAPKTQTIPETITKTLTFGGKDFKICSVQFTASNGAVVSHELEEDYFLIQRDVEVAATDEEPARTDELIERVRIPEFLLNVNNPDAKAAVEYLANLHGIVK